MTSYAFGNRDYSSLYRYAPGPRLMESDFVRLLRRVEPRAKSSFEPRSIRDQSRAFVRGFLKNIIRKTFCAAEARTCELQKLLSNKLKTLTEKEKELVCNCVCHFDTYVSDVLHLIQFPGFKEQQRRLALQV